jgi:APA family basic amino acid/polyamine antiporter
MLIQLETRVMAIGLGLGGLGALAALISMRYIRSDIKKID